MNKDEAIETALAIIKKLNTPKLKKIALRLRLDTMTKQEIINFTKLLSENPATILLQIPEFKTEQDVITAAEFTAIVKNQKYKKEEISIIFQNANKLQDDQIHQIVKVLKTGDLTPLDNLLQDTAELDKVARDADEQEQDEALLDSPPTKQQTAKQEIIKHCPRCGYMTRDQDMTKCPRHGFIDLEKYLNQ